MYESIHTQYAEQAKADGWLPGWGVGVERAGRGMGMPAVSFWGDEHV